MGLLLTDEHYQLGRQILEEGIKKDIEKNPKDEWYYRAMFWDVLYMMIGDRINDILCLFAKLNIKLEHLKEIAFEDTESAIPTTIEEYYNILIELSEDDQKLLIFDIENLPYQIKNQMFDVLKEKNYEQFKLIINNNTNCSKSFENNAIIAKYLILNRNSPIRYANSLEPLTELTPESYLELIYQKFPSIKDFDVNQTHSDDDWKMFIEERKWELGVYKHLYGDIFYVNDFSYDNDIPSSYYFIFEKIKDVVHNTDKKLLNVLKHIEIPQEAWLVERIMLEEKDNYQSFLDLAKQLKLLASGSKAEIIAYHIKNYFKNVFLVESCEEFGNKTRYEIFVSLLDDFVNGKPKPKDYQILAKTIYNSIYFIREDKEDKKLTWKSWYKEFCNACRCVYKESYDDQAFTINKKVYDFVSIFPIDPEIEHEKKRKKRAN